MLLKEGLEEKYTTAEKRIITSTEGQHLFFLINDTEISISGLVVYFRYTTGFNISHPQHVKEEDSQNVLIDDLESL